MAVHDSVRQLLNERFIVCGRCQLSERRHPLNGTGSGADLDAVIDAALSVPGAQETAAPFLPAFADPKRGVQAVVLYGSALWKPLRGINSHPDFFVLVDNLRDFHRGLVDRVLGNVLPPTVYNVRSGGEQAKLCVINERQLLTETSVGAKDLHLAGRFSKRIALVWSRDDSARQRIVGAQRAALASLARLALSRYDGSPVGLDDFLGTLLGLSYESEVRIVEPGKIAALLEVERDHYRTLGRSLLTAMGATATDAAGDHFRFAPDLLAQRAARPAELHRRLRRSRRRAYLRWPKYLVTYDGWLDYLLKKLARSGHEVSLTERQRRHPLIFALPILFQMIRTRRVS